MTFRLLYPGFKEKAVCFSYDDGVVQDKDLIGLFRKHGVKATFNLSPGISGQEKFRVDKDGNSIDCSHLSFDQEMVSLYEGMEVANHSLSHLWMNELSKTENEKEVEQANEALASTFHKIVLGFAYPFGAYGTDTLSALRKAGMIYARTTRSTYDFHAPIEWLTWHPTIHHNDPRLQETLQKFYKSDLELALCFIWGHAYEFALEHSFEQIDRLLGDLKTHDEIAFLTCLEAAQYLQSATKVYLISHPTKIRRFVNPSSLDVYVECLGKKLVIPAKGEKEI